MRLKTRFKVAASRMADVASFLFLSETGSRQSFREALKRREKEVEALSQVLLDHARFCADDKKEILVDFLGRTAGYAYAVRHKDLYKADAFRVQAVLDLVQLAKKSPRALKARLYQSVDTKPSEKKDMDYALSYAMKERASVENALLMARGLRAFNQVYRPK